MRKFLRIFWTLGLLSGIVATVVFVKKINFFSINGFEQALAGYLNVSSITLGFFATSISIIATIMTTKLVKEILGDAEYTKQFLYILMATILTGVTSIIFTIIFQVSIQGKAGQPAHFYDITTQTQIIFSSIWSLLVVAYSMYLALFLYVVVFMLLKSGKETEAEIANSAKEVEPKKDPFLPNVK